MIRLTWKFLRVFILINISRFLQLFIINLRRFKSTIIFFEIKTSFSINRLILKLSMTCNFAMITFLIECSLLLTFSKVFLMIMNLSLFITFSLIFCIDIIIIMRCMKWFDKMFRRNDWLIMNIELSKLTQIFNLIEFFNCAWTTTYYQLRKTYFGFSLKLFELILKIINRDFSSWDSLIIDTLCTAVNSKRHRLKCLNNLLRNVKLVKHLMHKWFADGSVTKLTSWMSKFSIE